MIVVSPIRSHSLPIGDIPTQVFRSAEPYRKEVVLIDAESERQFTIGDIITTSTKLAAGLNRQGFGGRIISVFDNTQLQLVYVYYAAMMAGGAFQSLDTNVAEGDLRDQIAFTQTPAIFTSHAYLHKLLGATKGLDVSIYVFDHSCTPNDAAALACIAEGIRSRSSSSGSSTINCTCSDSAVSSCCAPISNLLIDDPTFVPVRITSKDDAMRKPAYLAFLPDTYDPAASAVRRQRPLMLSHYSLLSSQRLTRPPRLLDAHRTVVSAVPFSGAHGVNTVTHFPMLSGSRVIQLSKSTPSMCLSTVEKWRAGVFFANYPVLASIDATATRVNGRIAVGSESFDASSLQVIFVHEMRVPQSFKERIKTLFQARLVELYGYIETGIIAGIIAEHPRIDDSVGLLCPNVKARVMIDGSEVGEDECGEIHVSTPRLASIEDGDLNSDDRFFCTGDYGKVTANGVVIIKGRMKDLIHMEGGRIVAPTDIEKELLANPGVADCAAFGVPADRHGDDVGGGGGGSDSNPQLPFVYVVPVALGNTQIDMDNVLQPLARLYPGIRVSIIDQIPKCDKGEPRRSLLREIATKDIDSR
ncbi:hypothetical protein IWW48_005993 [Coemansia sp. RSA 1200]|nr:hypothetical protein IWW48_005993 [Coemansia sp. RSA 1200]